MTWFDDKPYATWIDPVAVCQPMESLSRFPSNDKINNFQIPLLCNIFTTFTATRQFYKQLTIKW